MPLSIIVHHVLHTCVPGMPLLRQYLMDMLLIRHFRTKIGSATKSTASRWLILLESTPNSKMSAMHVLNHWTRSIRYRYLPIRRNKLITN